MESCRVGNTRQPIMFNVRARPVVWGTSLCNVVDIPPAPAFLPPPTRTLHAKDLITLLLSKDRKTRLGQKGDADEVLAHRFFKGIDL